MFKNKILLITGGTGSFGNAVLDRFLNSDVSEIRIFSRDEKKQDDIRKKYSSSKLKFYLGDIRDIHSIKTAMQKVDFVFHAAALKQVPSCEFYPMEALKTNVIGTENVLEAAILQRVKKVICLSTDKAVYPINAMGISKAMMEKVAIAKSRESDFTDICITRYGNVMGSRGSVIPLFLDQIINNQILTITDPNMTRFMMTLDDAVNLVLYAFQHGKSGEIFVQKSPASSLLILTNAIKELKGLPEYNSKIIGTRHGEKLYEVLLSREEMAAAEDLGEYFRVPPDLRDLNYSKFIEQGELKISQFLDYNSHNTKQLNLSEMKLLLTKSTLLKSAFRDSPSQPVA
jgi:UDP-N-acetylglucosamine 4,6-dehydratase